MIKRGRHSEGTISHQHIRVAALIVAGVFLFMAGFFLRGNDFIMSRFGLSDAATSQASSSPADGRLGQVASQLSEVEVIINSESLDDYEIDTTSEAVINAFLTTTNDSYSRYYSPSRYSAYVAGTNESYPGVGVFFAEKDGQAYALDVFENSSAAEQGVRPGDVVVAIDGDRSQTWSATEVINAVQRESGSDVVITWRRAASSAQSDASDDSQSPAEGSSEGEATVSSKDDGEFTTTLICQDYEEPNVSILLDGTVGYIQLRQFTSNSDALVRQAIMELTDQGALAFVLDLRDNPGGYLTKAVDVASLFIPSGVVVEIETLEGTTTKSASGEVATSAPLVVLVNGNTSGAAEVLVAALRDYDLCTIVGTTTMGRGSVQITTPLSFGGGLRYTAARYKSPSGYVIDGVGIPAQITVNNSDSADEDADPQRDVAFETAASLVASS